jgi:AbrB family looped-hinge helix DNA binding protein
MRSPFTTRISSRGQIVIPGPVRKALAIEPGTTFLVIARKDTVVLHRLQEPPWQSFDDMVKPARKQGRQHDAAMREFQKFVNKLRYGR